MRISGAVSASIQTKLTLLFGLALVMSLSTVGAISVYQAAKIAEKRLLTEELPNILGRITASVDYRISQTLDAGRSIANNSLLADAIEQGTVTEPQLRQQLKQIVSSYNTEMAFVVTPDGRYYTDQGLRKTLSPDLQQDQWFYAFLNGGQTYELALDLDEQIGVMMAFVNYRMARAGDDLAVTGVGVNLSEIAAQVNSHRIAGQGRVFLVDADGLVKVHTDTALVNNARLATLPGIGALADPLTGHQSFHVSESQLDGEDQFLASSYIPSLGWYLVATVPQDAVFAELEAAFTGVMQLVALLSLILLVPVFWISRSVSAPVKKVALLLTDIGEGAGDLTSRLDMRETNEIGQLANGFNGFVSRIQASISQVDRVRAQVSETLQDVIESAGTTIDNVNDQQQRVVQVASSMEQMRATIQEITRIAGYASGASGAVREQAIGGAGLLTQARTANNQLSEAIRDANSVIQQLDKDIQEIGSLLVVIREVSDNTNLLALNASIEAARAGEQGRGFAVVADEVRGLATKSHQLTSRIQSIITKLQNGAGSAMSVMDQALESSMRSVEQADRAGEAFSEIERAIHSISDQNERVAENLGQQSLVVEEVAQSTVLISDAGDSALAAARQSASACDSLQDSVEQLGETMSRFRY
ncbi:methyl-accepting chemotaxis protein [Marinobacterium jannaschii]|uniref:methyl-accepting chemotaxis protein n=1 Tax=Marinobacterium jannaschii TaxID=64970 RepID=UPI0004818017|nr:methyl-accepting chemotaxis protein [Marinobacterium jannaschii]